MRREWQTRLQRCGLAADRRAAGQNRGLEGQLQPAALGAPLMAAVGRLGDPQEGVQQGPAERAALRDRALDLVRQLQDVIKDLA